MLSDLAVVPAGYLAPALPSILVGLRFALGVMWLTLIFAETIAAQSGMQAREFMQTDVLVLSILLKAFLGKGADSLVKVLERLQLAWRPALQGPQ
jgi:sulfonate transport system permease protein